MCALFTCPSLALIDFTSKVVPLREKDNLIDWVDAEWLELLLLGA